jgi:membrane protease YdiL (CAAX protease family)
MKSDRTALTVIGLLLTLGCGSLPFGTWDHEFAGLGHLIGHELIWWALTASVLLFVLFAERRKLSSIGFRAPGGKDVASGITTGILALAGFIVIYKVLFPAFHVSEARQTGALMATPLWWRAISVLRAAVAEEVLFRGYPIERIQEASGSRLMAGLFSCAVFTVAHVTMWGWAHVLVAGFGGLLFTLLYLWRRNLWANIIAHAVVDGVAVLAG